MIQKASDQLLVPKSALMITTTRDFLSIQGARETANEVSRIYRTYGKEANFSMVEDNNIHTSTKNNRQAMYTFFQKQLQNPGNLDDEEVKLLSRQMLQVTHTGQVTTSLGSETIFSLTRKRARKEENELKASRNNIVRHLPKAVKAAKNLSGYEEPEPVDKPVFTGSFQKEGYTIGKYFIKGEDDGYPIPYLLLTPAKPNNKAIIYLNPSGKDAKLQQEEWFAQRGFTVLAPDIIGIGETAPHLPDWTLASNSLRKVLRVSILNGRSFVGVQAGDAVRFARLLQQPDIKEVYGLARRQLGPALLHAAAFASSLTQVALINPYSSYRSIVMNRFYKTDFIPSTVAGALTAYDLPDLAASLAPRKLLIAGMTDGKGKPADSTTIKENTAVIKREYRQKNSGSRLKIIFWQSINNFHNIFKNWLK